MPKKVMETTFDKFFNNRESLIYQYKKGDMSKKEFIQAHHDFIMHLDLKPFVHKIDSYEKGIYNYQYYNIMVKYCKMKMKDRKILEKHPEMIVKYKEKVNYYYYKKDETIRSLLRYLDYENIEAYYIKTKSDYLNGKLFEIVLHDYDNTVLHTINRGILKELQDQNVFSEEKRKSIIDDYVNERY